MKILGIDFGTKRIGIAISDENGKFALPHSVISNDKLSLEAVVKIAKENLAEKIVIGESKDYKGNPNKIMPEITEFKNSLEKAGFMVLLEPEFMTSVQAERFQGKNEMTDASAAAIILQSYLDKN